MTHAFERQPFYEKILGAAVSKEAFYDAVFSNLPWFPAYVIDKARGFGALQAGHPLPECDYFYKNLSDDHQLPANPANRT